MQLGIEKARIPIQSHASHGRDRHQYLGNELGCLPFALVRRKACTPKPSISRRLRGIPRTDIAHISVCVLTAAQQATALAACCISEAYFDAIKRLIR